MSCIPKLLQLKQEKGELKINDEVLLESGGKYKGYDYCVVFNKGGNRCGYVAVSKDSIYADKSKAEDLEVHGGVTFHNTPDHIVNEEFLGKDNCGDVWIGFDAAHYMDGKDKELARKLFPEHEKFFKWEDNMDKKFHFSNLYEGTVKDNEYIELQCKNLIDQIANQNG